MFQENMKEKMPTQDINQLLSDENYHHIEEVKKLGGKVLKDYIDNLSVPDDKKGTLHKIAKITEEMLNKDKIELAGRDKKEFTKDFLRRTMSDLEVTDLENAHGFALELEAGKELGSLESTAGEKEAIERIERSGKNVEQYLNKFNDVAGRFYSEATRLVIPKILPLGPLSKPVVRLAQIFQSIAFNTNVITDDPEYGERLGKGYNPINNFKIGLKFFGKHVGEVLQTKEEKEAALKTTKDYLLNNKVA